MKQLLFSFLIFTSTIGISQINSKPIAAIDNYIRPYVDTKNFSGTILIAYNNKPIYHKTFGYASEEKKIKNTRHTKFHIASLSKLFTSIAILKLEEEGKLRTTDLLEKYIPDFKDGNLITIHHLLTHTSGIPNINNFPFYDSISQFHQTPLTLVGYFKDKKLDFIPGTRYQYSNSNYNVLAYIIEKVSGISYHDYITRTIINPLKGRYTGEHNNAKEKIANLAEGYAADKSSSIEKAQYLDWSVKTGNGSIYSNGEDLLRLMASLTSPYFLGSQQSAKLFTNHFENAGYGIFVSPHLNRKRYYLSGRSPGVSSYLANYPDDHLTIIVLSNNYVPVAPQIGTDIAAILLNEPYEKPELKYVIDDKNLLTEITGTYKFDQKFFIPNFNLTITSEDKQLTTEWGAILRSQNRYIIRPFWADIEFIKIENKIIGLKYGNYVAEKL